MTRSAAIVLVVLLACTVIPPASATHPELPGDYPPEVRALAAELIASAEADAWPAKPVPEAARERLDGARESLDEGRVAEALERYISFRVEHAYRHLLDELSDVTTSQGQAIAQNVSARFIGEGRAAASSARDRINEIDLANATVRGAQVGAWGAYMVAQGEQHLNLHAIRTIGDLYEGQRLNQADLRSRLFLAVGGSTRVAVGTALASLTPHLDGPTLEPGKLEERVDAFARLSTPTPPQSSTLEHLPRGNETTDSELLRAGLALLAHRELGGEQAMRALLTSGTGPAGQFLRDGLAADQDALERWTRDGSPMALAAFEDVDAEVPDGVSKRQMSTLVNGRAFAQAVLDFEGIVSPETAEIDEDGTPGPGMLAALAALGAAALAVRRRRG